MNNNKRLFSIVVPVYQNEMNLENTVPSLLALRNKLPGYDLELVLVDDGSTDNSYRIMQSFQREYPESIVLVKLTRNFGQTPAIREGLRVSRGDCIGIISADLQDPPELFLEMITRWEGGVKLVIAERQSREEGWFHAFISSLYWRMVNHYAVAGFPVGGFDFCLLDREIKKEMNAIGEKNTSIFPLIFWLGYAHEVIPYTRRKRSKGVSQWNFGKKMMLTINTFINFTYLPVKVMTVLGISSSILAFIYFFYVIARWFFWGTTVAGWTTIVILVTVFGGLILSSLGIIGEYLWRILDESRSRPIAVVDEILQRKAVSEISATNMEKQVGE
jgi:dolichol-phosphate mannosyltransferase